MFNRVSSLILSVFLFFIFFASTASLSLFVIGLFLIMIAALIINYKRLGFSWPHLLLPCFYLLGTGGIYSAITNTTFRLIFLLAAVVVFYLMEMELGRESHFLQNIYLFSVFAIYLILFALQFYFPHYSFYWIAPVVFGFSYLLIIQGFAGFSLPVKKYFSFLIALVCAEVALSLSLWPTYYIVNAIITFVIFYLLWIFSFSAFFAKLNRNKIYLQLSLALFVILITLLSANFKPLVH